MVTSDTRVSLVKVLPNVAPLKGAPGTLFSWPVTENPSRATEDHSSSKTPKIKSPPDLTTKVEKILTS